MQTDFEAMGGTYTNKGDYLLPNVEAPESPQIGIASICRQAKGHSTQPCCWVTP